MPKIQTVYAHEILDCRGVPTIECGLWLDNGGYVFTSVPSGTSKGKYEALELRDGDANRYFGQGVLNAINNINQVLAPQLIGQDPTQQAALDQLLIAADGTPNKTKLGSNAILAVSQAIFKAGAAASNVQPYQYAFQQFQLTSELKVPTCIYGLLNGGEHGADNLDIQEFQVIPASHIDFATSLSMGATLFHTLEKVLISKGAIRSTGLSGGFAPNLYNNTDAFEILIETIKVSPYTFAQDLFFGVDMSASSFFEAGKYSLKDQSQPYSSDELLEYYKTLRQKYHVFYIEDPFQEDDWKSWSRITAELGETTVIAGDDLLVTNMAKIDEAVSQTACNAITVKPNQVGTITETVEVIRKAKAAGWQVICSHRSGETNDDLIADFAVGVGADYVRFGPTNRGERVAKFNRLLEIHQQLQARPITG